MFAERHLTFLKHDVLDETCKVHGCPLWGKVIPTTGSYSIFCPECSTAEKEQRHAQEVKEIEKAIERTRKTGMLERESIISPELKNASFETFEVLTPAEKEGLEFAQRMTKHYYAGGVGNVVLGGNPGLGKSHLALSILRMLNDTYAKKENFKSAVFMPVARLFSLITASFDGNGGMSEAAAIELLTGCDFLVLDDLGKESSYSHELKRANEWKQSVLFNILDNRERTIITTNFTADQLSYIYDPALYDRMLKGSDELRIRFDDSMISKR